MQQKLPITPHILQRIRLLLDLHKPCDILFWATCLLAYFGLLRKSNLLPISAKQFNPSKHPCRGDITKASGGLALHIKASKTIQFGERIHLLPLPYMQGHPLCPVTAITALLCHQPRQLAASSPLLTLPAGQLLTQPAFLSQLRALLQACGLPASDYSGHSFRRGAASAMFQAGLPGEVIQIMGDWKSDAYKLYLDIDIDSKFKLISPWTNLLPTTLHTQGNLAWLYKHQYMAHIIPKLSTQFRILKGSSNLLFYPYLIFYPLGFGVPWAYPTFCLRQAIWYISCCWTLLPGNKAFPWPVFCVCCLRWFISSPNMGLGKSSQATLFNGRGLPRQRGS